MQHANLHSGVYVAIGQPVRQRRAPQAQRARDQSAIMAQGGHQQTFQLGRIRFRNPQPQAMRADHLGLVAVVALHHHFAGMRMDVVERHPRTIDVRRGGRHRHGLG